MINQDVIDLYDKVSLGAKVVVLSRTDARALLPRSGQPGAPIGRISKA